MKLWHVAQWGNPVEGANGADNQVIISAIDMQSALVKAMPMFGSWRNGQANSVVLLGQDDKEDGPAVLIVQMWQSPALNLGKNLCWIRREGDNEWEEIRE